MVERAVAPKLPVDLLNRILESPSLVKMVQDLPPPVLTRLVRHIGLEDAAAIVAMATCQLGAEHMTGLSLTDVDDGDLANLTGLLVDTDNKVMSEHHILWLTFSPSGYAKPQLS
jgi:hypothetical protein